MKTLRPLCLMCGLLLLAYSSGCGQTSLASFLSDVGAALNLNTSGTANGTDTSAANGNDNTAGSDTRTDNSDNGNANTGDDTMNDNSSDNTNDNSAGTDNGSENANDNGVGDDGDDDDANGNANSDDDGDDGDGNDNSTDNNMNGNDNSTDDNMNGNDNSSAPTGDASAGSQTFMANGCSACHGADGSGPPNILGESFSSVEEHARNGQNHPGGAFPNLTDQDLADIEAFLSQ